MTGTFITVEGIDGSGKTLAVEEIEKEFDAVTTCEPTENWTGKQVRRALQEETASFVDFFLFMADRNYHVEKFIEPKVEQGEIVVSDRFHDSTLAYQSVQLKEDLEHPRRWMEEVMEPWYVKPDLTIFLDISVDTAIERCDGEEKYETKQMLKEVRDNYAQLYLQNEERYEIIDAEKSKEKVKTDVINAINEHIE